MDKHYIIISSSFADSTRIALDITEAQLLNSEAIAKSMVSCKQCQTISNPFG